MPNSSERWKKRALMMFDLFTFKSRMVAKKKTTIRLQLVENDFFRMLIAIHFRKIMEEEIKNASFTTNPSCVWFCMIFGEIIANYNQFEYEWYKNKNMKWECTKLQWLKGLCIFYSSTKYRISQSWIMSQITYIQILLDHIGQRLFFFFHFFCVCSECARGRTIDFVIWQMVTHDALCLTKIHFTSCTLFILILRVGEIKI